MASAVLAMAVLAVTQAVTAGQAQTYDALHRVRASALADALMEEILSKPYADPQAAVALGPDSGETGRSLFDNMDDYHGFSQTQENLTDAAGAAYPPTYQKFSRSVTMVYESRTLTGLSQAVSGLRMVVTVTDQRGGSWAVTRFVPAPAESG